MKDILKIVFMICLVIVVYIFKDSISNFILDDIIYMRSNKILTYNEYYLDYNYTYVQNIDSSSVKNKQEILNMLYSIINSGDNSFSFYCDYDNCLNDTKELTKDNKITSNINNFVHPFNSIQSINVNMANNGKITVNTKKSYSDKEIEFIKNYINNFIQNNINDSMSNQEKIKVFHDHIVNNTIYDDNDNKESHTAYNLLANGKAICGGYSDIISIYLNMLNIQNYKINSESHIWNLVYLEDKWYHLDATWDDPIASDGKQYLLHNFFLISTEELHKLDAIEHNFNNDIYIEAK